MDCANVAATGKEHLCAHDWHGYTQGPGRWGDGEGFCSFEAEGQTWQVAQGDRDCSSSDCEVWCVAVSRTPYAASLNGATYTGNMRSVFVGSGLFRWHPMTGARCDDGYVAQRGDLYLNEVHHVAMCTSAEPDMLAEFSINEFGGITGGQVGDQTGAESRIAPFYVPSFGWDGVLEYNHLADSPTETEAERIERERVEGLPDALKGYADVWPGQWYVEPARECVERRWMTGTSETAWEPNAALTRAMAVQVVARALGADVPDLPFDDIAPWYAEAVLWAESAGIAEGHGGEFRPEDPCTRAEFAVMLWRAVGRPPAEPWAGEPDWSAQAVGWAVAEGVFEDPANVRAGVACKRAEAAAMAVRALG